MRNHPPKRKSHPEHAICRAFMAMLCQVQGFGLAAQAFMVFHVPNEQDITGNLVTDIRRNLRRKEIGVLPGVLDYCVIWRGGMGFLEAKSASGRLTDNQRDFMERCEALDIPCEVFRSAEQGIDILMGWGLVKAEWGQRGNC